MKIIYQALLMFIPGVIYAQKAELIQEISDEVCKCISNFDLEYAKQIDEEQVFKECNKVILQFAERLTKLSSDDESLRQELPRALAVNIFQSCDAMLELIVQKRSDKLSSDCQDMITNYLGNKLSYDRVCSCLIEFAIEEVKNNIGQITDGSFSKSDWLNNPAFGSRVISCFKSYVYKEIDQLSDNDQRDILIRIGLLRNGFEIKDRINVEAYCECVENGLMDVSNDDIRVHYLNPKKKFTRLESKCMSKAEL